MGKKVKTKNRAYIPLFLLMLIVIISVIVGYIVLERKDKSFTSSSVIMGVKVHQVIYGNDSELATEKAKLKIQEIEDKLSFDIDGSDIDRINSGAGEKWVKSSEETIQVLDKFISIARKSSGVIDPTALPLMSLWGVTSGTIRQPSSDEINATLDKVDYRNIKINYDVGRVKIENKDSRITLEQVQKGMACSAAIDEYKALKVDYGVISVGGVVGVYGNKPDSPFWKISVKNPFIWDEKDDKIAVVRITNGFVGTFGVRSDKININGTQKNKILNAKTGYPTEESVELVSVLHPDAVVADALSHVCCCMGKDLSLDILSYYGAEAIFVYNDKSVYITPNLRGKVSIIDTEYTIKEDLG